MPCQSDDGAPAVKANTRVAKLLNFYLDTVIKSSDPSPNTIDNYLWSHNHLKPALGRKRITDLTAIRIEWFLVGRRDNQGLSKNSLQRLKSHIASALREAQRRDWLHRNVADPVPVTGSHSKQRRSLTPLFAELNSPVFQVNECEFDRRYG
ncbi:MAG: hypothetical protein HOK58_01535 [Acidimicrobiaceae bacterium]|nr:hypothetical protein [Acidimicrobiaceae bacterium]